MTAQEARRISNENFVSDIDLLLSEVLAVIKEAAEDGRYGTYFSEKPLNEDVIERLKEMGYDHEIERSGYTGPVSFITW